MTANKRRSRRVVHPVSRVDSCDGASEILMYTAIPAEVILMHRIRDGPESRV